MNLQNIPLQDILAEETFNCRGEITRADVVDLIGSIREQGLLQSVVVQDLPANHESGKKYKLLAGFRRYTAFTILKNDDPEKYATIPATIRDEVLSDTDAQYLNIIENLSRKDLTSTQEAAVVAKLVARGETSETIGMRLGKSKSWVEICKCLSALPVEIQEMTDAGFIKKSNIRELYTLHKKVSPEAALRAAKNLKVGVLSGKKNQTVAPSKLDPKAKRRRSVREIETLQDHLLDTIGANLATNVLGWAAGHLSDNDLFDRLEKWADEEGLAYVRPKRLDAEGIVEAVTT